MQISNNPYGPPKSSCDGQFHPADGTKLGRLLFFAPGILGLILCLSGFLQKPNPSFKQKLVVVLAVSICSFPIAWFAHAVTLWAVSEQSRFRFWSFAILGGVAWSAAISTVASIFVAVVLGIPIYSFILSTFFIGIPSLIPIFVPIIFFYSVRKRSTIRRSQQPNPTLNSDPACNA